MDSAKGEQPATLPTYIHPEQRLKAPQLFTLIGRGRAWTYQAIKEGRFPAPERDGPRCSRWRAGDVFDWLESQRQKGAA